MHHMDYGYGYGGIIMWVLIILAVAAIIYFAVNASNGTKIEGKEESALDILKRRYARGDISKEEFEEKKKDIQ